MMVVLKRKSWLVLLFLAVQTAQCQDNYQTTTQINLQVAGTAPDKNSSSPVTHVHNKFSNGNIELTSLEVGEPTNLDLFVAEPTAETPTGDPSSLSSRSFTTGYTTNTPTDGTESVAVELMDVFSGTSGTSFDPSTTTVNTEKPTAVTLEELIYGQRYDGEGIDGLVRVNPETTTINLDRTLTDLKTDQSPQSGATIATDATNYLPPEPESQQMTSDGLTATTLDVVPRSIPSNFPSTVTEIDGRFTEMVDIPTTVGIQQDNSKLSLGQARSFSEILTTEVLGTSETTSKLPELTGTKSWMETGTYYKPDEASKLIGWIAEISDASTVDVAHSTEETISGLPETSTTSYILEHDQEEISTLTQDISSGSHLTSATSELSTVDSFDNTSTEDTESITKVHNTEGTTFGSSDVVEIYTSEQTIEPATTTNENTDFYKHHLDDAQERAVVFQPLTDEFKELSPNHLEDLVGEESKIANTPSSLVHETAVNSPAYLSETTVQRSFSEILTTEVLGTSETTQMEGSTKLPELTETKSWTETGTYYKPDEASKLIGLIAEISEASTVDVAHSTEETISGLPETLTTSYVLEYDQDQISTLSQAISDSHLTSTTPEISTVDALAETSTQDTETGTYYKPDEASKLIQLIRLIAEISDPSTVDVAHSTEETISRLADTSTTSYILEHNEEKMSTLSQAISSDSHLTSATSELSTVDGFDKTSTEDTESITSVHNTEGTTFGSNDVIEPTSLRLINTQQVPSLLTQTTTIINEIKTSEEAIEPATTANGDTEFHKHRLADAEESTFVFQPLIEEFKELGSNHLEDLVGEESKTANTPSSLVHETEVNPATYLSDTTVKPVGEFSTSISTTTNGDETVSGHSTAMVRESTEQEVASLNPFYAREILNETEDWTTKITTFQKESHSDFNVINGRSEDIANKETTTHEDNFEQKKTTLTESITEKPLLIDGDKDQRDTSSEDATTTNDILSLLVNEDTTMTTTYQTEDYILRNTVVEVASTTNRPGVVASELNIAEYTDRMQNVRETTTSEGFQKLNDKEITDATTTKLTELTTEKTIQSRIAKNLQFEESGAQIEDLTSVEETTTRITEHSSKIEDLIPVDDGLASVTPISQEPSSTVTDIITRYTLGNQVDEVASTTGFSPSAENSELTEAVSTKVSIMGTTNGVQVVGELIAQDNSSEIKDLPSLVTLDEGVTISTSSAQTSYVLHTDDAISSTITNTITRYTFVSQFDEEVSTTHFPLSAENSELSSALSTEISLMDNTNGVQVTEELRAQETAKPRIAKKLNYDEYDAGMTESATEQYSKIEDWTSLATVFTISTSSVQTSSVTYPNDDISSTVTSKTEHFTLRDQLDEVTSITNLPRSTELSDTNLSNQSTDLTVTETISGKQIATSEIDRKLSDEGFAEETTTTLTQLTTEEIAQPRTTKNLNYDEFSSGTTKISERFSEIEDLTFIVTIDDGLAKSTPISDETPSVPHPDDAVLSTITDRIASYTLGDQFANTTSTPNFRQSTKTLEGNFELAPTDLSNLSTEVEVTGTINLVPVVAELRTQRMSRTRSALEHFSEIEDSTTIMTVDNGSSTLQTTTEISSMPYPDDANKATSSPNSDKDLSTLSTGTIDLVQIVAELRLPERAKPRQLNYEELNTATTKSALVASETELTTPKAIDDGLSSTISTFTSNPDDANKLTSVLNEPISLTTTATIEDYILRTANLPHNIMAVADSSTIDLPDISTEISIVETINGVQVVKELKGRRVAKNLNYDELNERTTRTSDHSSEIEDLTSFMTIDDDFLNTTTEVGEKDEPNEAVKSIWSLLKPVDESEVGNDSTGIPTSTVPFTKIVRNEQNAIEESEKISTSTSDQVQITVPTEAPTSTAHLIKIIKNEFGTEKSEKTTEYLHVSTVKSTDEIENTELAKEAITSTYAEPPTNTTPLVKIITELNLDEESETLSTLSDTIQNTELKTIDGTSIETPTSTVSLNKIINNESSVEDSEKTTEYLRVTTAKSTDEIQNTELAKEAIASTYAEPPTNTTPLVKIVTELNLEESETLSTLSDKIQNTELKTIGGTSTDISTRTVPLNKIMNNESRVEESEKTTEYLRVTTAKSTDEVQNTESTKETVGGTYTEPPTSTASLSKIIKNEFNYVEESEKTTVPATLPDKIQHTEPARKTVGGSFTEVPTSTEPLINIIKDELNVVGEFEKIIEDYYASTIADVSTLSDKTQTLEDLWNSSTITEDKSDEDFDKISISQLKSGFDARNLQVDGVTDEAETGDSEPQVTASILGQEVTFSVKIRDDGSSFFIPPDAYVIADDSKRVNITWKSSSTPINNSLSFSLEDIDASARLQIVKGNRIYVHKRSDPHHQLYSDGHKSRDIKVIALGEDIQVVFSNLDRIEAAYDFADPESDEVSSSSNTAVIALISGGTVSFIVLIIGSFVGVYFINKMGPNRTNHYAPNEV